MTSDRVVTYRGKYITEMSREELIEAVRELGARLHEHYTPFAITARAYGEVEMMKRGER